jgi:D-glycero-beta-D-manno-heptose-7-phosphate kinase
MKSLLRKISKLRVLVIGDVMLDHDIWGDASRLSPEAPVPVIDVKNDTFTAGGAGSVALNVAALGAQATVAGFFGRDDAGKRLSGILTQKGITTIATPGTGATIVKTRVLSRRQQLCRLDRESPQHDYAIDPSAFTSLFDKAVRACDAVIFSDYAKGLLTDELVLKVTGMARQHKKLVAVDPKPRRRLRFHGPDVLAPNRKEALQLAGIEQEPHQPFPAAEVCARIYEQYRPEHLVITLSEEGMLLSHQGRVGRIVPTVPRAVFDIAGTSEAVIASLTLALSAGAVLEEAAQFANAAATIVGSKSGTATVTPAELLAHFSEED